MDNFFNKAIELAADTVKNLRFENWFLPTKWIWLSCKLLDDA